MSRTVDVSSGPVLKALADPLRRRIVQLLSAEELCTCHLVEETGAGQTTVSNALRALREADVVEAEPCGRFTYYRLRAEVLQAVAAELAGLAGAAATAPSRKRPC